MIFAVLGVLLVGIAIGMFIGAAIVVREQLREDAERERRALRYRARTS